MAEVEEVHLVVLQVTEMPPRSYAGDCRSTQAIKLPYCARNASSETQIALVAGLAGVAVAQ